MSSEQGTFKRAAPEILAKRKIISISGRSKGAAALTPSAKVKESAPTGQDESTKPEAASTKTDDAPSNPFANFTFSAAPPSSSASTSPNPFAGFTGLTKPAEELETAGNKDGNKSDTKSWEETVGKVEAAGPIYSHESPGSFNAAKHVPLVSLVGGSGDGTTHVEITVPHGSNAEHYIEWIWAKDERGGIIAVIKLSPGETPILKFTAPENCTEVTAFEACNKHGTWRAAPCKV